MNLPLRPEVEAAFAAALELPASEQSVFLAREFPHDPNLRREVEELLSAFRAAGSFLDPVAKAPSLSSGAAAERRSFRDRIQEASRSPERTQKLFDLATKVRIVREFAREEHTLLGRRKLERCRESR